MFRRDPNFSPRWVLCPKATPFSRARERWSRPSLASGSPRALSLETAGGPEPAGVVPLPQIFWRPLRLLRPQLPLVLKLVPPQHISKKVLIELRLFAQNPDAFPIL